MNDRQAARLCKRILKLQSKLFAGTNGENYINICAMNRKDGKSCVVLTIKKDRKYKHISMLDGELYLNEI